MDAETIAGDQASQKTVEGLVPDGTVIRVLNERKSGVGSAALGQPLTSWASGGSATHWTAYPDNLGSIPGLALHRDAHLSGAIREQSSVGFRPPPEALVRVLGGATVGAIIAGDYTFSHALTVDICVGHIPIDVVTVAASRQAEGGSDGD